MKKSLTLIGVVSTFLFSSLVYASAFNEGRFVGVGINEGSVVTAFTTTVDDSKEIKNKKVTSSKKDENIKNSKNNNSSKNISKQELDRLSKIAAKRDPSAPNYRGAPVK